MKKHIIIATLYAFGGSNAHLKTLIEYLGAENVLLLLEDKSQLALLKNIEGANDLKVRIQPGIHPHAHLQYNFTTNVKELFFIIRSIIVLQALSAVNAFADITICATVPEKHLYLLWLPFCKVYYILHTTPVKRHTSFTPYTCNHTLGKRKKIITVSNANKNTLCQNWEIAPDRQAFVMVVYNCVGMDSTQCDSDMEYVQNTKTITTLGQLIEYKNPATWLEVAKRVTAARPQARFQWLGNGPLLDYYAQATYEDDRITFKGLVTQPGEYLKNTAIYYQPSLYETHGIAVVEAMSHGLPCVVSDTGGLPESVEDGYNGRLVGATDIQAHVNAIIGLVDDDGLCRQYGRNSRSKYLQTFTYDAFKRKMDEVYA
ncbi:glycosyltransferase family 4 protein [Mucilaginibacter psychrotolerans]|uniref:Glycosyltransferase n=1 Tax=Mucilaginibacter psychrotolerans TaxID=1524096 RepID=A0A4Y8SRB2_9SPHI|nr:glycosyltransferase family 4 protein [Mucilaginibacter psychrotolerans]TFF40876.1 glycosyltransferase [Mucilaginibacter psychrotolerans]